MRILIVEDNRKLSDWIAMLLRRSKYVIDCVYDGEDADYALKTQDYSLVILDLALPALSGTEVLARLRARGSTTPVLVLTADDSVPSRVSALDGGADDYLAKPFNIEELEARIRARLRRRHEPLSPTTRYGALSLDRNSGQFFLAGADLVLTPREHVVLESLILKEGGTVSKTSLMESVFGFGDSGNVNSIEIYVHRVRKKLEGSGVGIVTFRGLGYALRQDPC
ncbi:DNA-binding response regulator [Aliidongia dinghuensis]|uniref:DNA-binding response regulator n=1 Tax=Aliidongia dinghuensis TaxID=1867774 RepID=A0A8J2Z0R7_9PROT|nr:response regulator [Aliidongia dinghuensis]GGF48067.1 DNA-binding response regulator [Aliidongia dinghuensis]